MQKWTDKKLGHVSHADTEKAVQKVPETGMV